MDIKQSEIYRDEVVRLCDLTKDRILLDGIAFEKCEIVGPAVVAVLDGNVFNSTVFEGEPDAVLWEVPLSRNGVTGAILMRNCQFTSCRTKEIGFAGPPAFVKQFRAQVGEHRI